MGRVREWSNALWSRRYDAIVVSNEPEAQWRRLKYVLAVLKQNPRKPPTKAPPKRSARLRFHAASKEGYKELWELSTTFHVQYRETAEVLRHARPGLELGFPVSRQAAIRQRSLSSAIRRLRVRRVRRRVGSRWWSPGRSCEMRSRWWRSSEA